MHRASWLADDRAEDARRYRRSCRPTGPSSSNASPWRVISSGRGARARELDAVIEELIVARGGRPAFKGFHGYPASTCISVNEEVVHGIPDDRPFQEGDIVGLDIGVEKNGFYVDAARTIPVGNDRAGGREAARRRRRRRSKRGIEQAWPGNRRLTDISHAVERRAKADGFSVVRSLVGHGIGRQMHEDPQVPNFGPPNQGPMMEAGHRARHRADGERRGRPTCSRWKMAGRS